MELSEVDGLGCENVGVEHRRENAFEHPSATYRAKHGVGEEGVGFARGLLVCHSSPESMHSTFPLVQVLTSCGGTTFWSIEGIVWLPINKHNLKELTQAIQRTTTAVGCNLIAVKSKIKLEKTKITETPTEFVDRAYTYTLRDCHNYLTGADSTSNTFSWYKAEWIETNGTLINAGQPPANITERGTYMSCAHHRPSQGLTVNV